jgi:hypothetical protein
MADDTPSWISLYVCLILSIVFIVLRLSLRRLRAQSLTSGDYWCITTVVFILARLVTNHFLLVYGSTRREYAFILISGHYLTTPSVVRYTTCPTTRRTSWRCPIPHHNRKQTCPLHTYIDDMHVSIYFRLSARREECGNSGNRSKDLCRSPSPSVACFDLFYVS